ncbi:hypothetical protein F5Y17DRAFT_141260 [Xylariaceae sp. FL0594]|nr:hypothetical protein F5Y17DRAFT_141260 [Xylariaceae sp. FL0594]
MASAGRPNYGRRLMPVVLDELARAEPDRLYAAIPRSTDVSEGFRDITVADMARCVDFMAGWIERTYGTSGSFETISFIGIPDLRGAAIFQAAVKCGYKLLLPSPRNPPATNKSLMDQTGCTKLLQAAEAAPIVKQIQDIMPSLQITTIPSFDEMLSSSPEHYPFNKDFDAARNEPVVVLHSSGSTGLPKPITMTHGSFAVLDNEHNIPDVPGRRRRDWSMWTFDGEARVYTVFPFFHLAGFLSLTLQTIFMNASPVLGPPHLLPDATLLKAVISQQKLRSMFLPPAVIEQLLHEPNGIEYFKQLDFLVYSGAPFSPAIGDRLSKVVEIISPFGSTEVYPQPELAPAREDWAYHEFNPYVRHEMRPYDETEGTYELVVLIDENSKDTAAAYHNLPGISEYPTKDLFVRHPTKPDLYRYYGRRDDIIVLANGEKFNPIPLEVRVQNHQALKGVFVIGNGRRQAALLVEPKEPLDEAGRQKLLQDLWPLVVEANQSVPGQGRIQQSRVLCGVPSKPFTRTGKGTIVRKLTEEAYKDEIDRLYHDEDEDEDSPASAPETNTAPAIRLKPTVTYDLPGVVEFVRSIVSSSFPIAKTMKDDDDFLAFGLDSEQIIEIVHKLKRNLSSAATQTDNNNNKPAVSWIGPRTIFRNASISALARTIQAFLNEGRVPEEDLNVSRSRLVEDAVARFSEGLPPPISNPNPHPKPVTSVAVIGSTGYLGRYIVASLIRDPGITRVWCLSRCPTAGGEAKAKHEAMLRDMSPLPSEMLLDKLRYLTIDLSKPSLGLSPEEVQTVFSEEGVGAVVLNAWKSNFVLPLRSFDTYLSATRETIKLASSSSARIIFISSLAAVGRRLATKNPPVVVPVPEELIQDPLAAFNNGYAQSKLVAERLLSLSSPSTPVRILRVTQIGGPSPSESEKGKGRGNGKWADQGWLSAIARTSKTLNLIPIPSTPQASVVDWVPVDAVAEMVKRAATATFTSSDDDNNNNNVKFYNITHPSPQPWSLFVDALREVIDTPTPIQTTSFEEWIRILKARREDNNKNPDDDLPALTLLDYYEEEYARVPSSEGEENSGNNKDKGPIYATEQTIKDLLDGDAAAVPKLDKQTLKTWLESWDLQK